MNEYRESKLCVDLPFSFCYSFCQLNRSRYFRKRGATYIETTLLVLTSSQNNPPNCLVGNDDEDEALRCRKTFITQ